MDLTYQATGAVSLASTLASSSPAESPVAWLASDPSSEPSSPGMTEVNSSRCAAAPENAEALVNILRRATP